MPFVPTGRGLLARPGPACGVEPIPPPFFAPALKRSARRVLRVGFVPPGMLLAPLMSMRGGHCARPWLNVVRAVCSAHVFLCRRQGIMSGAAGLYGGQYIGCGRE